MKKCNCIVLYKKENGYYYILSVVIKHKHNNIPLYNSCGKQFVIFKDMFKYVVDLLKANNFYVHTHAEFDSKLYDIDFIDTNNFYVERYYM